MIRRCITGAAYGVAFMLGLQLISVIVISVNQDLSVAETFVLTTWMMFGGSDTTIFGGLSGSGSLIPISYWMVAGAIIGGGIAFFIVKAKRPSEPLDEIRKLGELLQKNLITQAEFDAKKSELLGL